MRAALLATVLAALLERAAAGREAVAVIVIRPADADDLMREVATRTHAELAASGVAAALEDAAPGRALDSSTTRVVTFRVGGDTITEVTPASAAKGAPASGRRVIHATGADSDPRVLAIRAVELVRATMLEPPPSAPAAPTAPEGSVRAAPPPPPPPPQKRAWSVGVGAAWLESTGGLGRALGVAARAERLRGDGLGLSLLIAAAPFASRLHTDLGTVTMDQELAELGLIVRARRGARLQPHVVVGAGGYHHRARGVPAPGAGGSSSGDGVWAVLACAGGGAALAVATGVGLFVDLQSILTYPFPAIPRDGGFARAGNPSLLASLGAQLAF